MTFVDARGQACPMPIVRLAAALRGAAPGEVVALTATDPSTLDELRAFCEATGHRLVGFAEDGGILEAQVARVTA